MSEQLFHSNVSPAPGNQIYLERPRIDRLLEEAIQNPVVIVSAGTGYGKTHAVYSFVRTLKALIGWIQFSERDNIGDRFWENFISGITLGNPRAAAKLAKLSFPETERELDRYMRIPEVDTEPDKRYIFVYDDFHLIRNKTVLRFVERSVTAPFPHITSIMISRTEPDLNLVKLLSKGLLGRITEEDLRFSREEMVEYFRIQNIRPSPQAVSAIYHDTEGWAFAIHLAGLSLKNAPSGAGYVPQAMRSNIFKLIESEIMATMSAGLRKFLIELSLIDHLVPELLGEIAAASKEGKLLIKEMEQISSFIRFDTYLNAYRIHHLFLDYLTRKQTELSEEEKRQVYQATAAWCVKNNQNMEAIGYYEKAGNYERLIGVIENMPTILPNRMARALLEIMENAPPEIYDQIATAQVIRTGLYLTLEMFDKSREELLKVIAKLEARPPSPTTYRTLAGCYNNLGFIGMNTCSYTRDYNYVHYFAKAQYYYDLNKYEVQPPRSIIPLSSYLCRVNTEEKGEMERYIEAISAAIPYTSVTFGGCALGMDDLCRGELAFFKSDLSGAEQFLLRARRDAQRGNQYETESRALFYLLRIHLARGECRAIEDTLKQLEAQLDEQYYLTRFISHDIITGWYYAHTGQGDKLAPWLKNDFEESDLNSIVFGLEVMVKAKHHLMERRYPAALAVLESWGTRSGLWDFVLGRIEKKILEAVCRYHLREKEAAFAALEEAYRLAHPNALYMPFMEMGKNIRTLAGVILQNNTTAIPAPWLEKIRRNASAYAKKLFMVTRQDQSRVSAAGSSGLKVKLSRRETEVLLALSQGMTREEIAGLTSLSVNTIKSITRSIYNKLGAINRADAVRIAVSLGLVPD
ncbi:MAG: LuxR C-terminal-related transcriptional regulator [Treponema sp.]|nr:LuxR C-terminal-related transcriptional regulator [Treponema sp.]